MGKRTWTDEELIKAVSSSTTLAEVSRKLKLKSITNPGYLRKRIEELELDTSNFSYWRKNRIQPNNRKKWSDDDLRLAIKESYSIAEVIRKLGLSGGPEVHARIQNYINSLRLDISHFDLLYRQRERIKEVTEIPLEEVLVRGRQTSSDKLRKRLVKEGLLKNECAICKLYPTWQEKPLILHLDHINGVRPDNRIENLRILCPNCHTQTPTYAGKRR